MKTKTTMWHVLLAVVVGVIMVPTVGWAGVYKNTLPGSGIIDTAHDLRPGRAAGGYQPNDVDNLYGETGDLNRICVWCHAPHYTLNPREYAGDIDYLPLWNHAVTNLDFQPYTNAAEEPDDPNHASVAERLGHQPGSVSRLCLSCHDGSLAVNEYGFAPGDIKSSGVRKGDRPVYILSQYKVGEAGLLSNHHPIGFNYQEVAMADDEIASASTAVGEYEIGGLLWNGKMECTTCHDVHNTKNTGEKLLWISDRNSELCLTCHLKDN